MKLTVQGALEAVRRIAGIRARATAITPALERGAEDVRTLVAQSFLGSTDPNTGSKWTPLAESTLLARRNAGKPMSRKKRGAAGFFASLFGKPSVTKKRGRKKSGPVNVEQLRGNTAILMDTSHLARSISSEARGSSIIYGTNVNYGAAHQLGGGVTKNRPPIRRFLPDQFNQGPAAATARRIRSRVINWLLNGDRGATE